MLDPPELGALTRRGPGNAKRISWPFGILFGFVSALASSAGFLMRHRGANTAPDIDLHRPLHSVVALFKERWWALGYAVALAAWLLHVAALKFAPLSLVQASLASSFVFLGVIADRWFGQEVDRRQWTGIGLAACGMALLGVTVAGSQPDGSESDYALAAAIAVEAGLVACGVGLIAARRSRRAREQRGVRLAAAAGLLFTVTHIAVKALSGTISVSDPSTLLTPWIPLLLAAFVAAFFASARSLQIGNAVAVISVTSATSNVSAIFAGVVVFGDPVGDNAAIIALRMLAFVFVVVAAMLMPAPLRAARRAREQSAPRRRNVAVASNG